MTGAEKYQVFIKKKAEKEMNQLSDKYNLYVECGILLPLEKNKTWQVFGYSNNYKFRR